MSTTFSSGITPLTFTGTSQYSSDFQSILNRAVQISSIPLTQYQNEDATILSKNSQLSSLQSAMSSLNTAVQALGTLSAGKAISATSSDPTTVSVTATGATASASYTINSITSLAAAAAETSSQVGGYADSSSTHVSSTGVMQLVVGNAKPYPINLTPATNNLVGLQNAINASGAPVNASILTTGSGNYLSVTANNLGAATLKLMDDPTGVNTDVLTSANQGSNAVFNFDNLPIIRGGNTINDLVSGASFTLASAPSTKPVTLTLAPDPTQISSAIQTLVKAYNGVVSQVDAQSGPGAGVLSGDSIIWQTRSVLQQLTSYSGSGSVQSLADMGVTLGTNGAMSFDQSKFKGLSDSQIAGAFQFFGSATSGFGGLSTSVYQISDPITGAIAAEVTSNLAEDNSLQAQITSTTANINSLQRTLLQQLSQADSLITTLNTQQSALSASVQSLDYVLYGYKSQASAS